MEDRADGCVRVSEIDRASGMVLSPKRNDDALAVHAEAGLVRAGSPGMPGAESDRGSGARSWRDRRSGANGAGERDRARRPAYERLESRGGNWRESRRARQGEAVGTRAFARDRTAGAKDHRGISRAPGH